MPFSCFVGIAVTALKFFIGMEMDFYCATSGKLKWPRQKEDVRRLTAQQVRWLLEGLSIDQPKAILPGSKGTF